MRTDADALRARVQGRMLEQLADRIERAAHRTSGAGPLTGGSVGFRSAAVPAAPSDFDALIVAAAQRHGVDTALIRAVIAVESGYRPGAVSSAGAKGLMQLMDATAQGLGVTDPFDPAQNIDGGTRYLRMMLDRFGEISLALAAYNAGPGAVERFGGIPPYAETQRYVPAVLEGYRRHLDATA